MAQTQYRQTMCSVLAANCLYVVADVDIFQKTFPILLTLTFSTLCLRYCTPESFFLLAIIKVSESTQNMLLSVWFYHAEWARKLPPDH